MGVARAPESRFDVAQLAGISQPLLVALIAALAALVVFVALPGRPLILHVVQKLGHPGVFALIALSVLALRRRRATAELTPWRDYLIAFASCVLLGAATEIAQSYTHRDPAVRDVGLDARGALCALALAAAFDRRLRPRRRAGLARGACLALSAGTAGLILAPLAWSVAAYVHRAYEFPVLFYPGSALDLYFVQPANSWVPLHLKAAAGAPPAAAPGLLVPLVGEPYAGVELAEPSADWRGYRSLLIDVTNPGPQLLALQVRVDDRGASRAFADRYNGEFQIAAGERSVVRIPLQSIAGAPSDRKLDLSAIARIILFRSGPDGPPALLLHRVTLE